MSAYCKGGRAIDWSDIDLYQDACNYKWYIQRNTIYNNFLNTLKAYVDILRIFSAIFAVTQPFLSVPLTVFFRDFAEKSSLAEYYGMTKNSEGISKSLFRQIIFLLIMILRILIETILFARRLRVWRKERTESAVLFC